MDSPAPAPEALPCDLCQEEIEPGTLRWVEWLRGQVCGECRHSFGIGEGE